MTDITIPPEAQEAAAQAIFDASPFREAVAPFREQSAQYQALTRAYARAACLAMLRAWPGAEWLYVSEPVLALPMPSESTNAEG